MESPGRRVADALRRYRPWLAAMVATALIVTFPRGNDHPAGPVDVAGIDPGGASAPSANVVSTPEGAGESGPLPATAAAPDAAVGGSAPQTKAGAIKAVTTTVAPTGRASSSAKSATVDAQYPGIGTPAALSNPN